MKFLLVSSDEKTHQYASQNGFFSYMLPGPQSSGNLAMWGTSEFNTITKRKKEIVTDIWPPDSRS